MSSYPFHTIEKKWQTYWKDHHTFTVTEDPNYPPDKRAYILDMFPYPSAEGQPVPPHERIHRAAPYRL